MLIFGCNDIGRNVYELLRRQGYSVEAFLDNAIELRGKSYSGIPIVPPSEYTGTDKLVLVTAMGGSGSAIKHLIQLNINNYAVYTDDINREGLTQSELTELDIYSRHIKRELELAINQKRENLSLSSIDMVISEGCTLRCKDCANLMQYFDKPQNAEFNTTTQAFDRLYRLTDWIYEVRILGGDAMVNPHLPEYLQFLSNYNRISDIIIYTNGIAMPKQILLDSLTDKRISVHITDYEFQNQKISSVKEAFNSVGVSVRVRHVTEWQDDCAEIRLRNRTTAELSEIIRECCVVNLPSLKDGMFWRCPLAGSLAALHAAPVELHECVDLLGSEEDITLKHQILELMRAPYLKVCDYCVGRPRYSDFPIPAAI